MNNRVLTIIVMLGFLFFMSLNGGASTLNNLNERLKTETNESIKLTRYERSSLNANDALQMKIVKFTPESKLIRVIDSGFHIYWDSPAFDNFVALVGKYLGKGTCLGMCEFVKNFHEKGSFSKYGKYDFKDVVLVMSGVKRSISGYSSLRELTDKEEESMKKVMDFAHLDNLRPESWFPVLVKKVFKTNSTYEKILTRLRFGRIVKISFLSKIGTTEKHIGPLDISLPDAGGIRGHALLVYKIIEFEENSLLFLYDPNNEYRKDLSNINTCLIFHKKTKKIELYPESYSSRYSWCDSINCVDGLTGPWTEQFKFMAENIMNSIKKKIIDTKDNVVSTVKPVITYTKKKIYTINRNVKSSLRTVKNLFSSLF